MISTIAVATSIVTTIVIMGVALLVPLTPVLNNPAVKPAFDNILPSLFGYLAVVYVSKNWKIEAVSAAVHGHTVSFGAVPIRVGRCAGPCGGQLIAIGSAEILYKNGKL